MSKEDIYVTSDDENILRVAERCGVNCIVRPPELAVDTASTECAVLHAVSTLPDDDLIIVLAQVTSPLRYPDDIKLGLMSFKNGTVDSLFSASPLTNPCIWGINMNSITYDYQNRKRRQDNTPYLLENGSFYIFTRKLLEKNNNRLGGKKGTYLMAPFQSHEIDEPDDVALCEYYMKTKILKRG